MDTQTLIQQIYLGLQKQVGFHRQLMEAVRRERDALITADLAAVEDITYMKEGLIEVIRQQELERLRQTAQLAMVWKRNPGTLSLEEIITQVQGEDLKTADQLRNILTTLRILIQRVSEQNIYNRDLVTRTLSHLDHMKSNVLGEAQPAAQTYNPSGQKTARPGGARLISQEA